MVDESTMRGMVEEYACHPRKMYFLGIQGISYDFPQNVKDAESIMIWAEKCNVGGGVARCGGGREVAI